MGITEKNEEIIMIRNYIDTFIHSALHQKALSALLSCGVITLAVKFIFLYVYYKIHTQLQFGKNRSVFWILEYLLVRYILEPITTMDIG